jgi:uncharacterized protein
MRLAWTAVAIVLLFGTFSVAQGAPSSATPPNLSATEAAADTANMHPTIAPGKEADIRKLLDMLGTRSLLMNVTGEMEKNIRPLLASSLPPGDDRDKLIELFLERFHAKANLEQLLDLSVPVYDKYLSDEDVKGLIAFYSSPLGQKAINAMPKVTTECMEVGRKWGEKVGRESMMEVLSEHPELRKAFEKQGTTKP